MVQHGQHALAGDVAAGLAVDLVADGHVVGGHGLRDGAGGAASAEEPVRDFLPRADFGKGAVDGLGLVDLEGLLERVEAVRLDGRHGVGE